MLIESLVQELDACFEGGPQHRTILWFDPKRRWEVPLRYHRLPLPLLVYEGSKIEDDMAGMDTGAVRSEVVASPHILM